MVQRQPRTATVAQSSDGGRPLQRRRPHCRFVPSFLRLGSWNVVMFISYEQLQRVVMLARSAPP